MRRLIPYAAVLLLLPIALLAPSPARAASLGSASAADAVLYRGCHHHTYRYDLRVPTQSWYLTVTLVGPRGRTIQTAHPYAGPPTGTGFFQLCDDLRPGTYTIRGQGEWYAETVEDPPHPFTLTPTRFHVRRAQARASLRVSDATPRRGQHLRYTVRARGERPAGYAPLAGGRVALQVRRGGRWHTVATATTGPRGRAVMRRTWHGPIRVRARAWHASYRPATTRTHRVA